MITCFIIVLNEWWYCISGDNFVRDNDHLSTAAFFETIFELFLVVFIIIYIGVIKWD